MLRLLQVIYFFNFLRKTLESTEKLILLRWKVKNLETSNEANMADLNQSKFDILNLKYLIGSYAVE